MQLATWATEYAAQLTDELGVPVVTDARDVSVPGAILSLNRVEQDRLARDAWSVEWDLILLGSTGSVLDALTDLGDVAGRLPSAALFEAVTYTNTNLSPDGIPALRTTLTTECEDD